MSQKKCHLPSHYNAKMPRCITIKGWRMERVEWLTSTNVTEITCHLCLRVRGKIKDSVRKKDVLDEARRNLIARLL